jgi:hypothetical protein
VLFSLVQVLAWLSAAWENPLFGLLKATGQDFDALAAQRKRPPRGAALSAENRESARLQVHGLSDGEHRTVSDSGQRARNTPTPPLGLTRGCGSRPCRKVSLLLQLDFPLPISIFLKTEKTGSARGDRGAE